MVELVVLLKQLVAQPRDSMASSWDLMAVSKQLATQPTDSADGDSSRSEHFEPLWEFRGLPPPPLLVGPQKGAEAVQHEALQVL